MGARRWALEPGQKLQGIGVTGPHHAEVAVVDGSELGFVEALDDGEDGSGDEADSSIALALNDLHHSRVVRWYWIDDLVSPRLGTNDRPLSFEDFAHESRHRDASFSRFLSVESQRLLGDGDCRPGHFFA